MKRSTLEGIAAAGRAMPMRCVKCDTTTGIYFSWAAEAHAYNLYVCPQCGTVHKEDLIGEEEVEHVVPPADEIEDDKGPHAGVTYS